MAGEGGDNGDKGSGIDADADVVVDAVEEEDEVDSVLVGEATLRSVRGVTEDRFKEIVSRFDPKAEGKKKRNNSSVTMARGAKKRVATTTPASGVDAVAKSNNGGGGRNKSSSGFPSAGRCLVRNCSFHILRVRKNERCRKISRLQMENPGFIREVVEEVDEGEEEEKESIEAKDGLIQHDAVKEPTGGVGLADVSVEEGRGGGIAVVVVENNRSSEAEEPLSVQVCVTTEKVCRSVYNLVSLSSCLPYPRLHWPAKRSSLRTCS